ncbi:MAG TPA: 3-hydroxyacyl-CoA dehydrogenase, partial [Acidobacteriaceae bacterium]|nr:3-hydroxyacyl-CoA dehydrogenase [Acidobacteriaceae bacterium]
VPGGGGCKEMALRAIDDAHVVRDDSRGDGVEIYASLRNAFETIAMAKVSGSAVEAADLRLLRSSDAITMNRQRLLHDARLQALKQVELGYVPPLPRSDIPAPGENVLANLEMGIHGMHEGGYISDHDVTVARHVAKILCGGAVTAGTFLSERHLLDLEVEAFLSLSGERKTQERIAHTLKTGKPLRN